MEMFHLITFMFILCGSNGQKTSDGVCSTDQTDDKCEIQNLRQELESQSLILQKMWDKINTLEKKEEQGTPKDCLDILKAGPLNIGSL